MGIEGNWGTKRTLIGFDVDSYEMTVQLHEAKIAGARVLCEQLQLLYPSRAIDLQTIQKLRGHMGNFRSPNSIWKMLIVTVDLLFQYTDGDFIGLIAL